ncbi:MAG: glycosyltransferase family 9 protein, partial [Planctomycetes bacterium]|nr:glycosyltransferase family 9 protein [Planctomycetota bacterium]
MATPTFRALARSFPDSCLVLVIRASVAAILRGSSWFEHIITYERDTDRPFETIFNFLRCSRTLHEYSPQLGILLPNSFSSALMFRLAGIERRTGYQREGRSFLLTDAVNRPTNAKGNFQPSYMVDYYLRLCEQLEISVDNTTPELPYTEHDRETARLKLRHAGIDPGAPLFLFHPAAGYGPAK